MTEWRVIALLVSGPILWMIGGTGFKWARRFVWPAVILGILLFARDGILSSFGSAGLAMVSTLLPYGDRTPWPVKVLVFGSIGLPVLAINPSAWWMILIPAVILSGLMWASRKWNFVTWKIWEGAAGFTQAAVIVMAALIQ